MWCVVEKSDGGDVCSSFSKLLYLSQTITTPTVFRMFDVFRMMIFCSENEIIQRHALEKIEKWAPG
jgi:ABC-2 type transport system ATP-binding protein